MFAPSKILLAAIATLMLVGCHGGLDSNAALTVNQARYEADLKVIAAPRPSGSAHWKEVQDFSAKRFSDLGYQVERQEYGTGVNVIATKPGRSKPDEIVIVSAHYDSVPNCPAADDNGSGVAAVLELAKVLANLSFDRSLVLALWDEEEIDYVGSRAYAARAKERGEKIKLAVVFEMIGFTSNESGSQRIPNGLDQLFPQVVKDLAARDGRADFLALVYNAASQKEIDPLITAAKDAALPIISLPVPDKLLSNAAISDLRRSDHSSFWDAGFPAIMLTDTSEFRYKSYHCRDGADTIDKLDSGFTTKVIEATTSAVKKLLNATGL